MSENTVTENAPETVEIPETVENAPENTAPETDAENTVNVEKAPEKSPAEKATEAIDALDESDPLKSMIGAFRKVLTEKAEAITALVKEVKAGGDEIEERIDSLIEDSEDPEIVKSRDRIEKMREALDNEVSGLRSRIAEENDLTPMTEEVKASKEKDISELRGKYNAAKTASEKALKNMLSDGADASVYFGDLEAPANLSGGTGTGAKKPRLKLVTVDGTNIPAAAGSSSGFPTFGDVAEYVSKKSGLTAVGNKIKPSELSRVALSEGLEDNGIVDFEFATNEGANKFQIHVETR